MADDRLIFPIGFDLDKAVKEAEKLWKSTYNAQMGAALSKKPVKVQVTLDTKSLNSLEAVKKKLATIKLQPVTPQTKASIQNLVRELKTLEKILVKIDKLNAAQARSASRASATSALAAQREARTAEIQARTASRQKQDAQKLAILEERKNQAILRTAAAQDRAARATSHANKEFKSQDGYINRLLQRSAILFSIYRIGSFVRQLREVTAEFELQRVSLGAIIQDTDKANALFAQIKDFAVQSPFEIKDLVSYVKQLSAFRIETDELFDTTKRLADISAGLGVDMDRIILAYGQVKAAAVLRGQELRQFTEAGIPLVQLLADKFTQLRGEMVSTGEVFELISKRAVPFEMVKEIFEDMTNAGGMFYDMQIKQAKTLAGQWSNLRDAYAIMLDEIGNTSVVNDLMTGLIATTRNLFQYWKGLESVFIASAVSLALYVKHSKAASVVTMKQIQAEKALEIQRIRAMAVGRSLTATEKEYIALRKAMTAEDYKRLIVEGRLGNMQLVKLARQSRNNVEIQKGILLSKRMTMAEIQNIQTLSKLNYALGLTKLRLLNVGAAIKSFGAALMSFLPFAIIGAGISLINEWVEHSKNLDAALEKNEKECEKYATELQRIENAYKAVKKEAELATDSDDEFAKANYSSKIEQLQKIAKLLETFGLSRVIDFSVIMPENIDTVIETWLKKLGEVNDVTKKFGGAVADIAEAYEGNIFGWSIFGENLKTDMKDLSRAWRKVRSDADFASELDRMRVYVEKMANESEDFYKNMSNAVGEDAKLALSAKRRNESDVEYWDRILKNYETISYMATQGNIFNGTYNAFNDAPDYKSQLKEVVHEFNKIKGELEGQDPLTIKATIDRIFLQQGWDDALKEMFIREANRKWKWDIPVRLTLLETPELNSGIKSIIANEFPSLFSKDELDGLSGELNIVDAIAQKRDDALKNLKVSQNLYNNQTNSLEKNLKLIKDINKAIEEEQKKSTQDRDDSTIKKLEERLIAIKNENSVYDKNIKLIKEAAEAEYEMADAAYRRVAATPLSSIAKDFKEMFPELIADAVKEATDPDYPVHLYVSEDELEGINNIGDMYDLWLKKIKEIDEWEEKVKDTKISQADIDRQNAALHERQAKAAKEKAEAEAELAKYKLGEKYKEYQQLRYNLSIADTWAKLEAAQEELDKFIKENKDVEAIRLALIIEQNEAILAQKEITGEMAQENIERLKKENAERKKALQEQVGEHYNFKMPVKEKGGGGSEDPWITLLKNRMKFMQDFQKGVEDLSKFLQSGKALGQERDIMLFRGKSLDIDVDALKGTEEELLDWFDDAIEQVSQKIAKLGGKMWEGLGVKAILAKDTKSRTIKAYQDLLQELFNQQTDFQTKKLKEQLEAELKRLSDEVARTKTAREFFDKMLNLTGDRELSATVTMDIYGETGEGLKKKIIEQIEALFATKTGQKIDLSDAINYKTLEVNYLKLAELAEKNKDILLESAKKERDEYISSGLQMTAARIENWEKELQKEKSYSEKRLQLAQETVAKIVEIEKQEGISPEEKDRLKQGYMDKEQREAAKMEYEAFKDTPMYVQMFDDLENASTTMLESMMEKLGRLKDQWGQSLGPTELKEMQGRINEIEKQIALRNPFKTLGRAFKEYRALSKEISYGDAIQRLSDDMQNAETKADEYRVALRDAQEAESGYNKTVAEHGVGSKAAEDARKEADSKWSTAKAAKEALDIANEQAETTQETVEKYKELIDLLDDVSAGIREWTDRLNVAFDSISDIMDVFGASEVDKQFFNDIVTGFNQVANGASQAVSSAASFMSGNIFGGITSGIGAISSIYSGLETLFTAGKVRRANKEIKKQQELLNALEHSYKRLQDAADGVFGAEYVQNFQNQQKNIQAQIVATQKQLEAEKDKGKKKDKDKIKDYEEKIQELRDELEDLQGQLGERMLGSDLTGAARTFVQSWLEAYKEFGDTRKAIEESMEEMMENLITEAVLGEIAKTALQPIYDLFGEPEKVNFTNPDFWKKLGSTVGKAEDDMAVGLENGMAMLESFGMNVRELGGEMTGISKDIATASEESITGLAAGINTQNYYISHIDTSVAQILAIMQGGGVADFTSGEQMRDLITMQNEHLAYLPTIAQHTADIVVRAERAAVACESMAANMDRVIKPAGVKGSFVVNTSL